MDVGDIIGSPSEPLLCYDLHSIEVLIYSGTEYTGHPLHCGLSLHFKASRAYVVVGHVHEVEVKELSQLRVSKHLRIDGSLELRCHGDRLMESHDAVFALIIRLLIEHAVDGPPS